MASLWCARLDAASMNNNALPAPLRELRLLIEDANSDRTGVDLWPSKAEALELLRFSNRGDERFRPIAICPSNQGASSPRMKRRSSVGNLRKFQNRNGRRSSSASPGSGR